MRLVDAVRSIRPHILASVQSVYDDEAYAEAPIGDVVQAAIREAITDELSEYGVQVKEGGFADDCPFTIAFTDDEAVLVDIPYRLYRQRPAAAFEPGDVYIHAIARAWVNVQDPAEGATQE